VANHRSCIDVWQLKIIAAIVKKLENSSPDAAILSTEILNSLLMRFRMAMDRQFNDRKLLLRNFLLEKNLNFLQELCPSVVHELLQLVVFFDLPLNFVKEPLNLDNVNLIQFMFGMKKRQGMEGQRDDFVLNLWKLLKN
jgi:hypothetical protein